MITVYLCNILQILSHSIWREKLACTIETLFLYISVSVYALCLPPGGYDTYDDVQ